MTGAFPLHWPEGWPRTDPERRAWSLAGGRAHTQTWERVVRRLLDELRRLGARHVVISSNQPIRRDGLPYAATRKIDAPGAAVYFTLKDRQMVMAQDAYELLLDNLRSLALAIESLRGLERHGGGHMMERAFAGFAALPPPESWREVLGLSGPASRAEVETAYRRLAKTEHPDAGGSTERFARLGAAYERALAEAGS